MSDSKLVEGVKKLLACWDSERNSLESHIENLRELIKEPPLHKKIEKTARVLGTLINPDKNAINQLHDPTLWEESAKRWTEKLKDPMLNQVWINGLADMCSTVATRLRHDPLFDVVGFVVTEQKAIHKRAWGGITNA
jgi:hypothetical protein